MGLIHISKHDTRTFLPIIFCLLLRDAEVEEPEVEAESHAGEGKLRFRDYALVGGILAASLLSNLLDLGGGDHQDDLYRGLSL